MLFTSLWEILIYVYIRNLLDLIY